MYAIIESGGKQYRVAPGQVVRLEKMGEPLGKTVELDQVLMIKDEEGIKIGSPYIRGARVIARVIEQGRDRKTRVLKMKRRKGYRKTLGHRQWFTGLRIQEIQV
jgi:large subunit ribosomal protein L21